MITAHGTNGNSDIVPPVPAVVSDSGSGAVDIGYGGLGTCTL